MSEKGAAGRVGAALARRPVTSALSRFWADDQGLSVFSALLFVAVFVVPPLVPAGSGRTPVVDFVYWLLLLSGVHALGARRLARAVLIPAALLAVAMNAVSWFVPVGAPWVLGTGMLSLGLLLVVILGRTLRAGPVTTRRIHGGVAAYLLLGVLWAHAYAVVGALRPGAFAGPVNPGDGPRAWLYFSFVTLTSTGYGDVLPVHPAARSLATLEAVTGSLYLAILIARLVSQAVPSPEPDRERPEYDSGTSTGRPTP
jgi:Zn-dependent protease with chaperone function